MSTGLRTTKNPGLYPFELSTRELIIHQKNISEYRPELSENLYLKALAYKPDLNLISQQPELREHLRQPCLEFMLKISIKTKVTDGIFYQAVKIFDRYCSKRIVLRNQLQLVLGACLWLSVKTYGGCNHVINDFNIPSGGRFNGPNPRARIPRLAELVQLCNINNRDESIDRSMFVQMERHILNTLNWDVVEPKLSNWLLEVFELNLLQLQQFNEEDSFNEKIEIINLKKLLSELSIFELSLLELHPEQITQIIFHILEDYYRTVNGIDFKFKSELLFNTSLSFNELENYSNLLYSRIISLFQTSQMLFNCYIVKLNCSKFHSFAFSKLVPESPSSSPTSSLASIHVVKPYIYQTPNSTKSSLTLPKVLNVTGLPTPPNSRKGSPAGLVDLQKMKELQQQPPTMGYAVTGFTSPLTPNDK
jgi:hypothetical protein